MENFSGILTITVFLPLVGAIIIALAINGAKSIRYFAVLIGVGATSVNPYLSEQMNVLKHSVPEFIKKDEDLFGKISRISTADLKDGGDGAFYVFLKRKKNL